jgi:hypothetical protein
MDPMGESKTSISVNADMSDHEIEEKQREKAGETV